MGDLPSSPILPYLVLSESRLTCNLNRHLPGPMTDSAPIFTQKTPTHPNFQTVKMPPSQRASQHDLDGLIPHMMQAVTYQILHDTLLLS